MGKVVTVMNMKGGVGKTTVTANVGGLIANYYLTGKFRRVLIVDYDAQFNLSQTWIDSNKYLEAEKARKTILSVLVDDDTVFNPYELQVPGSHKPPPLAELTLNCYASAATGARLDIVPSTLDLMYLALGQSTHKSNAMEERFSRFIAEAKQGYDLVLIDCHPAGSLFTKTALSNSDDVVIPVTPQRYAIRGIALMIEFVQKKKAGTSAASVHVLFNAMPPSATLALETEIRANKKVGPLCFANTLKSYKAFSDPDGGQNFVWKSTAPYSTTAFNNLHAVATEFVQKIGV